MKKQNLMQSSSTTRRAASSKFILSGLIAAAACFALEASSSAQISAFDFTLDGQFTGGFTAAGPTGEWSDVTPFSFISSPTGTIPTSNSDPAKNTQLYAAISHNALSAPGDLQLHLMYDFKMRSTPPQLNEIFASVTFPVTLSTTQGQPLPKRDISVVFQGNGLPSFFDVFVDLEPFNPANPLLPISDPLFNGLKGTTSAGGSPLDSNPHLLVELEVPLRIQPSQVTPGGPLPGGGINPATGMYDPDPVFWGASAAGGTPGALGDGGKVGAASGGLQEATNVIIAINGDGSLNVTPVPEPSTAALLLGGLTIFGARRRKSVSAS
jgi:hypothetical protein